MVKGPTAVAASVAKLDHEVASNGTLYNQKFLPSAVARDQGLMNFAAVIRSYFEKKGMHVQFNVIDKETLLDAQAHPENYKDLVVRVAGYSAIGSLYAPLPQIPTTTILIQTKFSQRQPRKREAILYLWP